MSTPRDLEHLSAYLDNAGSPAEKAKLAARLAREPELQAALEDLRWTRQALRSLPTLKPPRAFTLRPAQVKEPTPARPLFALLRFASALSAVALIITVIGNFVWSPVATAPAEAPISDQTWQADTANTAGQAANSGAATEAPLTAPMPITAEVLAADGGAVAETSRSPELLPTVAPNSPTQLAETTAPGSAASTNAPLPTVTPNLATPSDELAASGPESSASGYVTTATPFARALDVDTPIPTPLAATPTAAPATPAAFVVRQAITSTPLFYADALSKLGGDVTPAQGSPEAPDELLAISSAPAREPLQPPVSPWLYAALGLAVLTFSLGLAAWLMRKR